MALEQLSFSICWTRLSHTRGIRGGRRFRSKAGSLIDARRANSLELRPLKLSAAKKRPQEPQSRAGWPGCSIVELDRAILFRSPTQNVDNFQTLAEDRAFHPHDRVFPRSWKLPNSQLAPQGHRPASRNSYITIARFSSSCIRTGSAHPAISTRPAASSAALGETP
jgi:hypothetical protein